MSDHRYQYTVAQWARLEARALDAEAEVERLKRRAERAETTEAIWLAETYVLRAEVERLKVKRDEHAAYAAELWEKLDASKAEVERLKAALREAAGVLADYVNDEDPTLLRVRAALKAKP